MLTKYNKYINLIFRLKKKRNMKWLIKRIFIKLLLEDSKFRMKLIETIDPEKYHEIMYGDLKNPPPPPSKYLMYRYIRGDFD